MGDIRRSVTEPSSEPVHMVAYCGHYPHGDHTNCPSSVECTAIGVCTMCGCPTLRDADDKLVRHMIGVGAIDDDLMDRAVECRNRLFVLG